MKLNRKGLIAAIDAVNRARELRVSDNTTARMIVEAYLTAALAQNERAFVAEMTGHVEKVEQ